MRRNVEEVLFDESFKAPNVDPMVLCAYEDLNSINKRKLKLEADFNGTSAYNYLEEVLIDYMNAYKIANYVIKDELITDVPKGELAKLILYVGIGVQRREPFEIAFISGGHVKLLEEEKKYLIDKYEDSIEDIYDTLWDYIETVKVSSENKVDIKRIEDIYANLDASQKGVLKKLSKKKNVYDLELLEEIIIDKETAIKIANIINEKRDFDLKLIDSEDIKYLLLYYGIGVSKRIPEELYLLEKHPYAISLDYFKEGAKQIMLNSTDELLLIYDTAMEILSIDNIEGKSLMLK